MTTAFSLFLRLSQPWHLEVWSVTHTHPPEQSSSSPAELSVGLCGERLFLGGGLDGTGSRGCIV